MNINTYLTSGFCALVLSGCGGAEPSDEMSFDPEPVVVNNFVVLTGKAFVPNGSSCPPGAEYVRFGSLGPHSLTWHNAATGATGQASASPWVCNADGGRRTSWRTTAPIELKPGDNAVTVTMSTPTRASYATTVLRGSAR